MLEERLAQRTHNVRAERLTEIDSADDRTDRRCHWLYVKRRCCWHFVCLPGLGDVPTRAIAQAVTHRRAGGGVTRAPARAAVSST
ncbi:MULTISPECIES: hypothetical protein [unclassified Pseudofrankia]|uniref:hypothetical protein n=1 Tax=unclassified Pseudofrankia TaxID=2994372 RepID=UPI001F517123|nr:MULTISPECIES: hypothetical protein [unclassified Pseudofrankia]MDT3445793.1 hypothetical protein [Pseudofrankia sp. BMG5.37]